MSESQLTEKNLVESTKQHDKLDNSSKPVSTTSPEGNMIKNQRYTVDDRGVLVSPAEKAQKAAAAAAQRQASMTAKDVKEFIMDNSNLDPKDKNAWNVGGIKLTREMLLLLSPKDLKEIYDDGGTGFSDKFQIARLFQTFGLPIQGLPGVNPGYRG